MSLGRLLSTAATRTPDAVAIRAADGVLSYAELDQLAGRVAAGLLKLGVRRGDRVAVAADKSVEAVAAIQGALRLGAAYVPLDPQSPPARAAAIARDCAVAAVVATTDRAEALAAEGVQAAALLRGADAGEAARRLPRALAFADLETLPALPAARCASDDLAYVLYTSGSTGSPKGVCLTHGNALAFVRWASAALDARAGDVFANHAPFHFDLSVLDLYVPSTVGASVVLMPTEAAYAPARLVDAIEREGVSIWYSVPSVLMLMMERGDLLRRRPPSLRTVVFAGEPFPPGRLEALRRGLPGTRMLNFYGPTETNVCTYHEVPDGYVAADGPLPIGVVCCGDIAWAVRDDGADARPGEEGELMVAGPTVMRGYWGGEPLGEKPYATGDLVRVRQDGGFDYVGRRDAMLKVRGHRIEPAEVERVIAEHPAVDHAVVCAEGTGVKARLVAFVVLSAGAPRVSLLAMKQHCARRLPRSMIVDEVRYLDRLPLNRNGKVDRRSLAALGAKTSQQERGKEDGRHDAARVA